MSAAEPVIRRERTFGISAVAPEIDAFIDSSAGGEPIATRLLDRVRESSWVEGVIRSSFRNAPLLSEAEKSSSR